MTHLPTHTHILEVVHNACLYCIVLYCTFSSEQQARDRGHGGGAPPAGPGLSGQRADIAAGIEKGGVCVYVDITWEIIE